MRKKDVLDHFGGALATAKALRITHQAVYKWPPRVPLTSARKVERKTKGVLKLDMEAYRV